MEQESFVFGSLTLVMFLGVVVLLTGVAELGNTFVGAGTLIAMGSVVAMAMYLAQIEGPESAEH